MSHLISKCTAGLLLLTACGSTAKTVRLTGVVSVFVDAGPSRTPLVGWRVCSVDYRTTMMKTHEFDPSVAPTNPVAPNGQTCALTQQDGSYALSIGPHDAFVCLASPDSIALGMCRPCPVAVDSAPALQLNADAHPGLQTAEWWSDNEALTCTP